MQRSAEVSALNSPKDAITNSPTESFYDPFYEAEDNDGILVMQQSLEKSPEKFSRNSPFKFPQKSPSRSPVRFQKSPHKFPFKSPEKIPFTSPEKSERKSPEKSSKSGRKSPEEAPAVSPNKGSPQRSRLMQSPAGKGSPQKPGRHSKSPSKVIEPLP